MQRRIRVVIVHGWMGTSQNDWMPWLGKELRKKGINADVLDMPDTRYPNMERWNEHLSKQIGKSDKNTFLVGHSLGGQAILRYLANQKGKAKLGGALIVASWINRRKKRFASKANKKLIAPWLRTPFAWNKIRSHARSFTAIYSDNDPYVPMSAGRELKQKLGAKFVLAHNKWHFNSAKYPIILEELLSLIERSNQKS
ncbi:MAG: serine hydrolase family protein [Candidatus Micrarchaeota archaeon]|nr:serine hydrolase family protein [Candidatus Micrarchaeota archaeon]